MASNHPPTRLSHRLLAHLRPAPITSAAALRIFLDERAALIAQKCAIDYCRGKTGLASYALFTEEPFLKALDVCRWETFVAVLGDLLLLAEASRGEPRQALDVADHSARRLFDTLPIHSSMREVDEEVVYGAVRFRMIAVSAEMERRFCPAELARHLVS